MHSTRLRKSKSANDVELLEAQNKRKREEKEEKEEGLVAEKKAEPAKKRRAPKRAKKAEEESKVLDNSVVEEAVSTDLTLMFPNEVLVHILSFLTYKEIIQSAYIDKRWYAIGSSAELWGVFCRKMKWALPSNNRKLTHKSLFLKRVTSKTYCCCCGVKTSCRFSLLNVTLCKACRTKEPEFATLNKGQSKVEYFLDDYDLEKVRHVVSGAGWGRKKYVYLKSEIIAAALAKFGGQEGLDKERERRTRIKRAKSDKLVLKKENRARLLEEELQRTGWNKKYAVGSRSFPILLPSELLNDNYDQYLRAPDRGNPVQSFAYVFSLNCQRYLSTGFGALFVSNMDLVDQIEAYFEKEKTRDNNNNNNTDNVNNTNTNNVNNNNTNNTNVNNNNTKTNNNNNTTTTTTTATSTSKTNIPGNETGDIKTTPDLKDLKKDLKNDLNNNNSGKTSADYPNKNPSDSPSKNTPDSQSKNPPDSPSKNPPPPTTNPANGRPLTTYAGATYDAELRKFYLDILFARIEQIWQHPGRFDLPEESVEEDDHMGVLFDKHAHFCKKLKTPNDILQQIYDDAATAMFGFPTDSDDDSDEYDPDDSDDDLDSAFFCPLDFGMIPPFLVGDDEYDDDPLDRIDPEDLLARFI